jgi:hypothetical protein
MITSCFGVITTSQFILGLYITAYMATEGGESVAKCRPQFSPTSAFQHNRSCRSHFGLMGHALPCDVGPWKSDLPPYLSSTVRNFFALHLEGDGGSDHPTDLLAFLLIVYLVLRSNVHRLPMPSLLMTIAQDATCYFLVIFTSHVILELTLLLGRVGILS